jgi:probable rRNA maturation factor
MVDATLGAVGRTGVSVTVAFVRDRAMQDLNRQFRAIDRATDVLSFPAERETGAGLSEGIPGISEAGYLGDIAVSTDAALRQAIEAGHSFERELDELLIHGVVHLCGYDHETDSGEMNRLELKLRTKLLDQK